jgi:vacuolar-type H+-ATPase subunit F/Vma7
LVTGFLLAGIGERQAGSQDEQHQNFLIVPEEREKEAEW